MTIKYFVLSLLLVQSIALPQWPSFDLSSVPSSQFQEQIEPFTRSVSFMIGYPISSNHVKNQRFQAGVSYGLAVDMSGKSFSENPLFGFPTLHGSFLVSDNLNLNGSISGLHSGKELVQVSGYGFDLMLTKEDSNSTAFSMNFAYLDGPSNFRCRTIHSSIVRKVDTQFVPINYGFGVNLYSAHISVVSEDEIPSTIEGQTNYVFIGINWPINRWKVGTKIHFHPNTVFFSFDLLTSFR
jgi:hypothetical protein